MYICKWLNRKWRRNKVFNDRLTFLVCSDLLTFILSLLFSINQAFQNRGTKPFTSRSTYCNEAKNMKLNVKRSNREKHDESEQTQVGGEEGRNSPETLQNNPNAQLHFCFLFLFAFTSSFASSQMMFYSQISHYTSLFLPFLSPSAFLCLFLHIAPYFCFRSYLVLMGHAALLVGSGAKPTTSPASSQPRSCWLLLRWQTWQ